MSPASVPSSGKRRYNSSRRALQAARTRADIVEAAIALFGDRGWSVTTVAAVAEAADVAVETVYNGFGSKKGLLRAAMDAAVVGDTEPVPFVERPEFASMGEGSLDERIARAVAVTAAIHERSAGVWLAIVEAASGDEEVDGWRLELERGRRIDVGRGVEQVLGRAPDEPLTTLVWLLYSPEAYLKLVNDEGMSRQQYEQLLVEASRRLMLEP